MSQTISNLPIGAKVKLGSYSVNGEAALPIIWLKVGNYYTIENSVTLLTEKIIDLRPYDAMESLSDMYNPKNYGNVNYSLSNIDQWLNKDGRGGEWFAKTHSYDESPNTTNTQFNTPYTNRPAFLNGFTSEEKSIIIDTPIEHNGSIINRKVFLLKLAEIFGNNTVDAGFQLDYFKNGNSASTTVTSQCLNNTTCQIKPSGATYNWAWLTRSHDNGSNIYIVLESGTSHTNTYPKTGQYGVRPALNISSNTLVSDTTDNDGCYTILYNQAPSTPTNLRATSTLYANKPVELKWDESVDPDGDNVIYDLSRRIWYSESNVSTKSDIYRGDDPFFTTTVPNAIKVEYILKATDLINESDSISVVLDIQQNTPPTISGSDSNLGIKTTGFSQTYVVNDADTDDVIVTEYIDGVSVRSYNAALGVTNTFNVINEEWLKLTNGSHTLTIEAYDEVGNVSTRNYTFTKNVTSFTIQTNPISAITQPTRIALTIGRSIPTGATFVVEVCNNGYDTNPTWEDCTSAVLSNLVHSFTNTTKTSSQWGVSIRISVNRNGSSGACYVDAIGGNFE